jgi:hypothetical protein
VSLQDTRSSAELCASGGLSDRAVRNCPFVATRGPARPCIGTGHAEPLTCSRPGHSLTNMRVPLVALLLVFGLAACGREQESQTKPSNPSAEVIGSDAPSSEAPGSPTPGKTVAIGTTAAVGDWDVKVIMVELNANSFVDAASEFNESPKAQYVLVRYSVKYTGTQPSADPILLTWTFTGSDSEVYNQPYWIPPDNRRAPKAVRPGETATGLALFDLAPAALRGGMVNVEGSYGGLVHFKVP